MFAEYKLFEYGADLAGNVVMDVSQVPNPSGKIPNIYIESYGRQYTHWMVSN